MTKYAVTPMDLPAVTIADTDELFPVRRIYCVGRNYAEHAREMGSDPDRDPPFFFMKPNNSIIADGADFPYPTMSENVHYEMELVVAIGTGGSRGGERGQPGEWADIDGMIRTAKHVFLLAVSLGGGG